MTTDTFKTRKSNVQAWQDASAKAKATRKTVTTPEAKSLFVADLQRGMAIGFKIAVSVYGVAFIGLTSGIFAGMLVPQFLDMVWDAK